MISYEYLKRMHKSRSKQKIYGNLYHWSFEAIEQYLLSENYVNYKELALAVLLRNITILD